MATSTSDSQKAIAHAAYTRGRLHLAASRVPWILPFALSAVIMVECSIAVAGALTIALGAAFATTQFIGLGVGRGGRDGLLLGALPFAAPWLVERTHLCCLGGSCESTCFAICALAGFGAGLVLGIRARHDASPFGRTVGGLLVMIAASAPGCAALDFGGLAGVAAGFLVTVPMLALTPRRA